MTATAFKPKAEVGPTPAKAPVPQQAKPKAAASRPKLVALKPMRREAAGLMRKLAASVQQSHPDMNVHDHLRDAAKQVEAGNEEGAQRHLRAAFFSLTPQSLHRSGLFTDDAHTGARQAMHAVHRHILLVKNIADADAKNQEAIRRDSGDGAAVPPPRPDPNAGYGPGANAQKPTARQPPGDQAMNAPATSDGGGSDPSVADPGGPQVKGSKQFAARGDAGAVLDLVGPGGWQHGWTAGGPTAADHDKAAKLHTQAAAKAKDPAAKAMHMRRAKAHTQIARKLRALTSAASAGLAYDWGDVLAVVDLSAKTATLEATPAPRGKPGGPGLYHVAGQEHTNYLQSVVKALIEKRGMPPAKAYAVAYGALRKWSKGGGKVSPEVSAAATGSLAGEQAKAHAHAVTWHDIDIAIEMATVLEFFNPAEARVPVGSAAAGQFSAGGAGAQSASGQQPAKGKPPAKPLTAAQKHALHVAHVAHTLKVSTAKAGLLVSAQDDRQKAAGLIKQKVALEKALASAGGKVSTGQAGAKTSTTATTKTTAPAVASTSASTTAAPASTSATTASTAKAPASTAAKSPAPAPKATSAAGLKTQINALNTQISALLASAAQASAQAAKMK